MKGSEHQGSLLPEYLGQETITEATEGDKASGMNAPVTVPFPSNHFIDFDTTQQLEETLAPKILHVCHLMRVSLGPAQCVGYGR